MRTILGCSLDLTPFFCCQAIASNHRRAQDHLIIREASRVWEKISVVGDSARMLVILLACTSLGPCLLCRCLCLWRPMAWISRFPRT